MKEVRVIIENETHIVPIDDETFQDLLTILRFIDLLKGLHQ